MKKEAVSISNLSFSVGGRQLLDNVSLSVEAGSLTILLGKNGSGKSTLFKIISGLIPYQSGDVLLFGRQRKHLNYKDCAQLLGFLPQFHKAVFPFKVREVLLTGRAAFSFFASGKEDINRVNAVLEEMEISHLADRSYTELSGGEQQLVMIARVLIQNPPFIMLDEPTNHLDTYYQVKVMDKLQQLKQQGTTIFCIMHDPNLAALYADTCHYIEKQKIITWENQSDYGLFLERIYGVPFEVLDFRQKKLVTPKPFHL
jgi:iron complex transport system ATP-binding protein